MFKKIATAACLAIASTAASANAEVLHAFSNPSLEKFFISNEYATAASKEVRNRIGDSSQLFTILITGDYRENLEVLNGAGCMYSFTAVVGIKNEDGSFSVYKDWAPNSRSSGIIRNVNVCAENVNSSILKVLKDSIDSIEQFHNKVMLEKKKSQPAPKAPQQKQPQGNWKQV